MSPLLILLGYIILALFALTALSFAPWVPTKNRDVRRAIKLSGLQSGEIFYDLGCGDGRVVIEAAKIGANATGIELFPLLYLVCLVRKWIYKRWRFRHSEGSKAKGRIQKNNPTYSGSFAYTQDDDIPDSNTGKIIFKCKNLFSENLSRADVVFLFGTPSTLKKQITDKLDSELKPGARVISYVFAIEDWTPEKVCKGEKGDELSIFVYRKK